MNRQMKAYCYLAMAMAIAGSAVVAGKIIVSDIPIFLGAELGIAFSLPFLLFPALRRHKTTWPSDRKTHIILFAQGLCGVVLYRVFMFWGLKHTSATAAGLIGSTAPVLIAFLAVLLLREKLPGSRLAGAACVSIGITAMNIMPFLENSAEAGATLLGNCLVLAAILCESLFSVMSKSLCQPISALVRTTLVSLYAFACLLPLALYDAVGYDFARMNTPAVVCLAYYGFFVSFLSYVFWFKGVAEVPAGVAGSFTGFVPLSSVFFSWLVLHEHIDFVHWIGLLFVLTGIFFSCASDTLLGERISPIKTITKNT
ncbi:MAG: hypothetical protein BCS36_10270 [Desulfovibrio sp. MES5]|uniref:DMT family transporter n=1 Tax=Desulfovibrio sp. MES5 TaxID=1899016 RepID=UPI000B9C876D|nr:DMT family transporter [Desulfovibrio sp. MES5]OXS28533.1 MAG: hypothetical protein BCS36_10270 [Desulfovibrio sp. MES5]